MSLCFLTYLLGSVTEVMIHQETCPNFPLPLQYTLRTSPVLVMWYLTSLFSAKFTYFTLQIYSSQIHVLASSLLLLFSLNFFHRNTGFEPFFLQLESHIQVCGSLEIKLSLVRWRMLKNLPSKEWEQRRLLPWQRDEWSRWLTRYMFTGFCKTIIPHVFIPRQHLSILRYRKSSHSSRK